MKAICILLTVLASILAPVATKATDCDSTFTYTSTVDGQGIDFWGYYSDYSNYTWNMGDGNTEYGTLSTYTYATAGTYNVCLTISDSTTGCNTHYCQQINVTICSLASLPNSLSAGFSCTTGNGDTVSFANQSTGQRQPLSYYWYFYHYTSPIDTFSSSQASPTVTLGRGNTAVWLTVTDASGCQQGFDTTIYNSGNGNCIAQILDHPQTNTLGPIQFADSINVPGSSYQWSFGDGTTSTDSAPQHTYTVSGLYEVCLTVTNATQHCADTLCQLKSFPDCGYYPQILYTLSGATGSCITFSSNQFTSTPITSYQWTFGNNTTSTSTAAQPVLNLSGAGTETAQVLITDSAGCVSFDTVSVQFGPQGPFSIQGEEFYGGCPVTVYLIRQDTIGFLTLIDSLQVCDTNLYSNFTFTFNIPGTYFCKGAAALNNPGYDSIMPTYSYAALSWVHAQPLYYSNAQSDGSTVQIVMQHGANPGGPGFIGGYISQGAGLVGRSGGSALAKSISDPLAGVQVDLTTQAGTPVAYTFTDVNGKYSFGNLPYGTYTLFIDELNKNPMPINVTISAENPDDTTNLTVDSTNWASTQVTEVEPGFSISSVYPNPFSQSFYLDASCTQPATATLKLFDILGRTVHQQPVTLTGGNNHLEIDPGTLVPGIYQLMLETGTHTAIFKMVHR